VTLSRHTGVDSPRSGYEAEAVPNYRMAAWREGARLDGLPTAYSNASLKSLSSDFDWSPMMSSIPFSGKRR